MPDRRSSLSLDVETGTDSHNMYNVVAGATMIHENCGKIAPTMELTGKVPPQAALIDPFCFDGCRSCFAFASSASSQVQLKTWPKVR